MKSSPSCSYSARSSTKNHQDHTTIVIPFHCPIDFALLNDDNDKQESTTRTRPEIVLASRSVRHQKRKQARKALHSYLVAHAVEHNPNHQEGDACSTGTAITGTNSQTTTTTMIEEEEDEEDEEALSPISTRSCRSVDKAGRIVDFNPHLCL